MRDTNLVNALREHAEWAEGNQWETPITLCDDLVEAADRIEAKAKKIDALWNELCLKCGNYTLAHEGACNGCKWRKM
nr:MAG TPA: 50S ribosomal protein L2 [Caudoviricetes sp.]